MSEEKIAPAGTEQEPLASEELFEVAKSEAQASLGEEPRSFDLIGKIRDYKALLLLIAAIVTEYSALLIHYVPDQPGVIKLLYEMLDGTATGTELAAERVAVLLLLLALATGMLDLFAIGKAEKEGTADLPWWWKNTDVFLDRFGALVPYIKPSHLGPTALLHDGAAEEKRPDQLRHVKADLQNLSDTRILKRLRPTHGTSLHICLYRPDLALDVNNKGEPLPLTPEKVEAIVETWLRLGGGIVRVIVSRGTMVDVDGVPMEIQTFFDTQFKKGAVECIFPEDLVKNQLEKIKLAAGDQGRPIRVRSWLPGVQESLFGQWNDKGQDNTLNREQKREIDAVDPGLVCVYEETDDLTNSRAKRLAKLGYHVVAILENNDNIPEGTRSPADLAMLTGAEKAEGWVVAVSIPELITVELTYRNVHEDIPAKTPSESRRRTRIRKQSQPQS